MAKELDESSDPAQFGGADTDHRDRLSHDNRRFIILFSSGTVHSRTAGRIIVSLDRTDERGEQESNPVWAGSTLEGMTMDISPVNRSVPAPAQSVSVDPVDRSGQNRDVVQAVKAVNSAEMFGDNELEFQRDPQTHRMLIRVVNRKTKELISQIPPDYVLRLAENLKTPKP